MSRPDQSQKLFTAKELANLLLTLFCLAIAFGVCMPFFAHPVTHQSPRTTCISNKKQTATAVTMYAWDYDEQFPFAGHSDLYSSAHPDKFSRLVFPYIKNNDSFSCSMVIEPDREPTSNDEPAENTGTAYFCGHGPMDGKSSLYDSPFRKLLLRNGPNGESNPKGEAILDEVDQYFVCGHKMSEVSDPATAPLLMCNGFVHDPEKKTAMEWEWEFLPKSLGGSGRMAEAGTILVRADSSAKFKKGKFGEMMELLGLRKPLFLARKSK